MTKILNLSRLGAVLLPCVLALTPTFAIAQTQPTPPPAAAPPAGGMKMGDDMMKMDHDKMMMGGDKMKSGMGMKDCAGKPCGPPQGAPGQMGGMPQTQGMAGPGPADTPAAPARTKEHM